MRKKIRGLAVAIVSSIMVTGLSSCAIDADRSIATSQTPMPTVDPSPIRTDSLKIPEVSEVESLLRQVAPRIDVSAKANTLLKGSATHVAKERAFQEDRGGVWCAGAADFFVESALGQGWHAAKLQYGFQDYLTHAVSLVFARWPGGETGWAVADAYLGEVWEVPLEESFARTLLGWDIPVRSFGVTRDVLFSREPLKGTKSWVLGRSTTWPLTCRNAPVGVACIATHDSLDFRSKWGIEATLDHLEAEGNRRDLSQLILYPYGLMVDGQYVEVSRVEDVLVILEQSLLSDSGL